MSKKFDELVSEAVSVERQIRKLSSDKPSIRGWVDACLSRGGLEYADVEDVKSRLGGDFLRTRAVDSGAYLRDIRGYIKNEKLKEPPTADRIGKLFFSQRDGAIAELGGEPRMLFTLFAVAAESVYQEKPELFGGIPDIDAHKATLAKLAARREELFKSFPSTWKHEDLFIGKITADGAALISFRFASNEVPVYPPATAGERLVGYLLEHGAEKSAKAA